MANSIWKKRKSHIRNHRIPLGVDRWFLWLAPGLYVKRWLLLSMVGILFTSLGLAIWVKLTPVYRFIEFTSNLLETIARFVPSYVSGPIAIALGLALLFWGQKQTLGSITSVLNPDSDTTLIDVLTERRLRHRAPKIVAIGGGTGLSTLLRGLKVYSVNLTAIVTVADDGGSSGRLRRENGVLPPGDIRNCLAALADEEKLLTELFQYRFQAGEGLTGHSFGNLFLTAMSDVAGDLEQAIAASSKVLAVRGCVLPATLSDVRLWAQLEDGRRIEGESSITAAGGKIRRIGCTPERPVAPPAAIRAIEEADLIVLGPGSLYTSVIPNLLVPQICEAIARSQAARIYICNIMTQAGETDGFSVSDHIREIDRACGRKLFDAVMVHRQSPSAKSLIRYAKDNSHPVALDRDAVERLGRRIVLRNVMEEDDRGCVRHDSQRLAREVWRWYARTHKFKR